MLHRTNVKQHLHSFPDSRIEMKVKRCGCSLMDLVVSKRPVVVVWTGNKHY